MAFERVTDIVEHAKQFHRQLSALYGQLAVTAEREKIRILLNYMSRHEQHLVECLGGYEKDAAQKVLGTWFKFVPEMPKCKCFECVDLKPDMSVDQIIETALRVDRCLLKFYAEAAEKAVVPEVKDLFSKLVEMEKHKETERLRNALAYDEEA
ncbi:MAG TPA: ferritin family protein [Kiritimatiellia bacterium]|nr:ferritin family protein [Kiritimatiellia bacterium]